MAEAARALYASETAGGKSKGIQWTDGRRVYEVVREPEYRDSWPECPHPAVCMVLDVREDGKSVLHPDANPFYFVGIPDEVEAEKDTARVVRLLVQPAVTLAVK